MLHPRTRIEGSVAYLTLTRGHVAVIDAKDAALVGRFAWQASEECNTVYATRSVSLPQGGRRKVRLHRVLTDAKAGNDVDHINGNGLDNRRKNLRECSHMDNRRNTRRHRNNKSGFKGVSWNPSRKKWCAFIYHEGKSINLGGFATPEEAHNVYCRKARELHGEFARFA